MYRNNLENYIESNSSMDNTSMMDIEEMVKLGNHRKICPYFHSREFCTSSDLVLLPYNYLLDGAIRNTVKVDWSNAIIIFDEAHNLERVSADAASISLSSTDLALCIQEMQQVLSTLRDEQQRTKAPTETEALQKLIVPANPSTGTGPERPTMGAVVTLLKAMFELEKRIDSLQMQASTVQQQSIPGLIYPGVWLPDLLKTVGFSDPMVSIIFPNTTTQ
jgi:Rad3-related DNA helicase